MGVYLNSKSPYGMFREDYSLTYYVDKTDILSELVPLIELKNSIGEGTEENLEKGLKYVAVTRPRRFGKTVMANMIASYFGKGADSHKEFDTLKAARQPWYKKHLNQHNVIFISFNETPSMCNCYEEYIKSFIKGLLIDLIKAYPEAEIEKDDDPWYAFKKIYEYCNQEKFIFILDEWDYIYHQRFATDADKDNFTKFLSN